MERKREYLVLAMAVVSIICLGLQMLKPEWCTGTSSIMYIIGGNQLNELAAYNVSRVVAAIITAISMLAMVLFTLSVYRGNIKGRLKTSYSLMLLHTVVMIIASMVMQKVLNFNKEDSKMSVGVYFITILILAAILIVYILRESGGMRLIPNLSSVMLLVVLGQLVSNGLFIENLVKVRGVLYGVIAAFPYLTIFVFEKLVLEPTMKKYR